MLGKYQKSLRMLACAAAVTVSRQAMAQYSGQYQLNTIISATSAVPFSAPDPINAASSDNYTSMQIFSLASQSSIPNGPYQSPIVGRLTGSNSAGQTVQTLFSYDSTNGLKTFSYYNSATLAGASYNDAVAAAAQGPTGVDFIAGDSPRNDPTSNTNGVDGQDGFYYTSGNSKATVIPLVPNNSSYIVSATTGATYNSVTPNFINTAGQVVGTSGRYVGGSIATSLGTSAWLYSGGATTTEIGEVNAAGYFYVNTAGGAGPHDNYANSVFGINASGEVLGAASAYADSYNSTTQTDVHTSLGTDGWVQSGSAVTAIGLGLQSTITPSVPGYPAFSYTDIAGTGSNPSGTYRNSGMRAISANGQVAGYSQYWSSATATTGSGAFVGDDSFVYTPASGSTVATYTQIGLISNGFPNNVTTSATSGTGYLPKGTLSYENTTGARASLVNFISATGQTAGSSTLYVVSNTTGTVTNGQASFFEPANSGPSSAVRIGLYDASGDGTTATSGVHTGSTEVQSSTVSNMTNNGFVGGFSSRYVPGSTTTMGQDAWVYDPGKSTTFPVEAPTEMANDAAGNYYYATTTIDYLSETGIAVGTYSLGTSTSSTGASQPQAFIWYENGTATGDFIPLDTDLSPSLSTSGYADLIASFYADGGGDTVYASATTASTGSTVNGLVSLTAVPEPGSMAIFVAASLLLKRRRKSCPKAN